MYAGVDLRLLEDTAKLYPKRWAAFEEWQRTIEGWMQGRLWIYDDVFKLEDIERITRKVHREALEESIRRGDEKPLGLHFVVGDVQVTKDAGLLAKQAENPFYRTLYGQKYLYLRRQVGAGALSV